MLIKIKPHVVIPSKNRKEDNAKFLLINVKTATVPIIIN